jgi:hypothetical protein
MEQNRREHGRPTEIEQGCHGPDVDDGERDDGNPVNRHSPILSSFKASNAGEFM